MNRFLLPLSRHLHSADQQIGHHTDVIRDDAPVDLPVEVRPRHPFATKNIKSSFQIRDHQFNNEVHHLGERKGYPISTNSKNYELKWLK